jgi:hypothetical protein
VLNMIDSVMQNDESEDEATKAKEETSTKKRKKMGRMRDVAKKLRACSFETGEDCHCKRYKCFLNTTEEERKLLIKQFNEFKIQQVQQQQFNESQNLKKKSVLITIFRIINKLFCTFLYCNIKLTFQGN